jgi:hypothetical protein
VLERPGKASVATMIELADREHTLIMPDARSLKGTVTGRGGRERLEGADVTLYTIAGALHARTGSMHAPTGPASSRFQTWPMDASDSSRVTPATRAPSA